VEKLKPNLYRALIDEAHKNNLRVMAHVFALDDVKDLVRSGIDGFAHMVRDKDVDDELIALLKARPNVFFVETLWGERRAALCGQARLGRRSRPAAGILGRGHQAARRATVARPEG
jgi:imidazolonepropionase-like amidohydrolase